MASRRRNGENVNEESKNVNKYNRRVAHLNAAQIIMKSGVMAKTLAWRIVKAAWRHGVSRIGRKSITGSAPMPYLAAVIAK